MTDPYAAPEARHWKIIDASTLDLDVDLDSDIVIIGSGAAGGIAAEMLAEAGLGVILVEEGPLRTSRDFRMREAEAYPDLYQESAARKTRDKAINIFQGRCVGGGTTVNWTSSFRTPTATLEYWARNFDIAGWTAQDLAPWFERVEARLEVSPWTASPNANNAVLVRGAAALGIPTTAIARNVTGCANLGYCGLGCPIDAKRSTLVTAIPAALKRGATLVTRTRAIALEHRGGRATTLRCAAMDRTGTIPGTRKVSLRARVFIAAAGAIGTPALLLRSGLPDPGRLVGTRTFLHPVVVSAAEMPERVEAWSGAPQSVYADQFIAPPEGMGYKLETPPVHPILAAVTLPGHGRAHAEWMERLPNMQVLIALLRDGFHVESPGGKVLLRDDGSPLLDYPLTDYLWEGARRAFATMAEIQFAAGARRVMPIHGHGTSFTSWPEARSAISGFVLAPQRTPVVSAHVMGGCAFGPDPRRSVVDLSGRHHHVENVYVLDASIFPTSIGANPQLSIFTFAARLADGLARSLRAGSGR